MKHTYLIDGKELSVDVQSKDAFFVGKNEILSQRFGDLTQKKLDKAYRKCCSFHFYFIKRKS